MAGNTYKRQSEYSAINTIKRFFAKFPESDSITVDQIFESAERNKEEYIDKNDGWLSNRLTGVYYHGLVKPTYSYGPWRKLESIELTVKGKRLLGRVEEPQLIDKHEQIQETHTNSFNLTVDDILMAVPKINERLLTHRLKVTLEEVQPKD
jgi:hypothetical protein